MRDFSLWAMAARHPDDDEGSDVQEKPDAAIREKLGVHEDEELDLSEFTDAERAELLGNADGDDDDGADDGGKEADGTGANDKGAAGKTGQEDEGTADTDQPPPKGFVSLRALQEARAENRELRQRVDQAVASQNEFQQKLALRLAEIRGGKKEGAAQEDVPPDSQKDPLAAIAYWQKKTEALEARINGKETEQTEATEQAQREQVYVQKVMDTADQVLTVVAKEDPTVTEAFEFAQAAIAQELATQGFSGQRLQAEFQRLLIGYAENAPSDPARFKEYVKRNARYWGWEGGKAPAKDGKASGNGETKLTPTEKLALLKKGVKASKSLSGGGHGSGGELNIDDLAEMSAEELEKLAESNPELFEAAAKRA